MSTLAEAINAGLAASPAPSARHTPGVPDDVREAVRQAQAEADERCAQLTAERDKAREQLRLLGQVFENHGAAMRAAYIEAEIGEGPVAAMQWITNTLVGPGLLPDLEEAQKLGGAQGHFDSEYKGMPDANIGLAARALLPQPTERRLPMETVIDVMCAGEEVAARARAAGFALHIVQRSEASPLPGQRVDVVTAAPLGVRTEARPTRELAAEVAPEWVRNDDDVFTCLMLVGGHSVPREAVTTWTDRQCWEAEDWAIREHLVASDNDEVERASMPEHVRAHPPRPFTGNSVDDLWSN